MIHLVMLASLLLPGDAVEKACYVRLPTKPLVDECEISLTKTAKGTTIESVNGPGAKKLIVTARYDAEDNLLGAEAVLTGDDKKSVTVTVMDGTLTIKQTGKPTATANSAKGIIVTSAPDWTDVWSMCRRYDRAKGGKQAFPGLWIHPIEQGARWTFTIEKAGEDAIEHMGKKVTLDRFTVRLRDGGMYVAWADDRGRLIKVVPQKGLVINSVVLKGFEDSTLKLRP